MAENNIKKQVHDSFEKRSIKVSDEQQAQIINQMITNIKSQDSNKNTNSEPNK
jgi:hypothetical protein